MSFSSSAVAVCVVEQSATLGTVADGTNTYVAGPSIANIGSTGYSLALYFAYNATLAAGTITYTKAGTAAVSMAVLSATNIATSAAEDAATRASATGSGNGPVLSVTSGTPAQAGELFLTCLGGQQSGYTTTSFFTQDVGDGWASPFAAAFSGSGTNTGTAQAGGNQVVAGITTKTFATTIATGSASRTWGIVLTGLKHP